MLKVIQSCQSKHSPIISMEEVWEWLLMWFLGRGGLMFPKETALGSTLSGRWNVALHSNPEKYLSQK